MTADDRARLNQYMKDLQDGDESAFRKVYRIVVPYIAGYVRGMLAPNGFVEVDDFVQEVFLRIHKSIHSFRPELSALAWSMAICRYTTTDYLRRRYREKERFVPMNDTLERTLGTGEDQSLRLELLQGLGQLTDKERELILLTSFVGFDYKELAGILGSSAGSLRVAAMRARRKLKSALENEKEA